MFLHCLSVLQLTGASFWYLAPSPADTHIKHRNDLFSLHFNASLWMKFTKKSQRLVNMTRQLLLLDWSANKKCCPTFLTCASLIFSKAILILSAFNLAACSSWMEAQKNGYCIHHSHRGRTYNPEKPLWFQRFPHFSGIKHIRKTSLNSKQPSKPFKCRSLRHDGALASCANSNFHSFVSFTCPLQQDAITSILQVVSPLCKQGVFFTLIKIELSL